MEAGPACVGGDAVGLLLDRGQEAGSLVRGEAGVEADRSVPVHPVAEVAAPPDGLVGAVLVLAARLDPTAAELEDAERLSTGGLHQVVLGTGLEDRRAGDLLDLGLGELSLAHRLIGGGQGAEIPGRLERGDRRPQSGAGGLGDVGGRGAVAGAPPDVGGLHAACCEELAGRCQALDLRIGLEQAGGVASAETLGVEVGQGGPELVGDPAEPVDEHGAMLPGGCDGRLRGV